MTKSTRIAAVLVIALAAATALAQSDAQKSFAQLKSLTGSWEGQGPNGTALRVSWRETAGGSAILSEILGTGPENMISMFHMDGANRLLMTHYCGAGNQPRMQASVSPDGKTITFSFVDGTNIEPGAGHMQKMVLTMLDDNHHTEDWTFIDHGKEMQEFFDLRRKM
ncbi:MAG: hypothetical protein ACLPHP_04480 [Candidatus Sulfotelmatobacter sp.]